jgi:CheY-like chemotaxis protein
MEYSYFPVTLGQLAATIRYHELTEGSFRLGSVMVHARYLNHPGLTLGYRLEANGVTMVYATDHEPHSPHHPEAGSGAEAPLPVHREDQGHVEFLAGADLVVHDAQYTLDEYPEKRTWGHSPAERAVDFALAARVKRLALFHHDPGRSDDDMDRLLAACRQRAEGSGLDVFAAVEGQVVELAAGNTAAPPVLLRRDARLAAAASAKPAATTILLVDDDPEILDVLVLTFEAEGYRVLSTDNGDTALELARAERPDLLILDWRLPGRDGLSVCRALRADPDPQLREVPVVLVTGQSGAEDTAAGFAAGVTDYVTKPFKPSHLRARVHAWLLRRRSGSDTG